MHKPIFYLLIMAAFLFPFQGSAQQTHSGTVLSGKVSDAGTGELLDAANVVVLRGDRTVAFAITNEKGEFSIPLNVSPDTLTLSVSMMGYAPFSERIGSRAHFDIKLDLSPIQLKEVTIRPGRIWGRSDTIRYDASKFLRENDKTVEDLMKRLPGIQVDDDGKIQYRGKDIGTMYVEGLDLMDSRYKSVSRNLSAQSVKEVEVLDNHQRIKSLAGKIPSDVADINIKLKDNFKDKWSFKPKVSAGFSSDDFLYEAEASALQIARKSQSLYALKFSNTGNGITKEGDKGMDDMPELPDYRLLQSGNVSAPLKENRWLFDDAALATGNRLYRLGEDSRLKINAFYTEDRITQQTNAVTSYFNPDDTVTVEENKSSYLRGRQLNISADYEENAVTHYLRNKLDAHFEKNRINTGIAGSYHLTQHQKDESLTVQDNLTVTRTLANKDIWQMKSVVGYWRRNQRLQFNNRDGVTDSNPSITNLHSSWNAPFKGYDQPMQLEGFYALAESGWIIRRTKIAQHYTAGASVDWNSLKDHHRLWVTPAYEYLFRSLTFRWSVPLQVVLFPGDEDKDILWLPGLTFRTDYKLNYAWNARLSVRYGKELNDITAFYPQPYFTDYRTTFKNETGIPVTNKQLYTLRTEYKNTLREFFVTADITASRGRINHTMEQRVTDNIFRWTRHYIPHHDSSYGVNMVVSKGFFDLNTKVSAEASYWYNRSAQMREGVWIPFSFRTLILKPSFSISPTQQIEVAYTGELQRQSSSFENNSGKAGQDVRVSQEVASSDRLWNMRHKGAFYYMQRRFDLSASAEYFRNEITPDHSVNLLFVDLTATYKLPRMTLQLQLNNSLNHRDYRYTVYHPLSVYSSQIAIRPREILFRMIMDL
ncbi:MAG: carboxypeptidase-like regulatory domain-containing protein [Proteiniphilum sp.]|uniref:carboxypeptidase-like regulatory domain-containing protein n=1 Tax=Proteiniphilum sp. TaxID=1926877 RepID=UPI002B1EE92E|nr:carboxypeptidase-like regulatory domain-containing protein [Proteiniphilum sp.]MEA5127400.1 carboxypeptidase-like regulatory domain-containing protein [Proteiniphilum sp.]